MAEEEEEQQEEEDENKRIRPTERALGQKTVLSKILERKETETNGSFSL